MQIFHISRAAARRAVTKQGPHPAQSFVQSSPAHGRVVKSGALDTPAQALCPDLRPVYGDRGRVSLFFRDEPIFLWSYYVYYGLKPNGLKVDTPPYTHVRATSIHLEGRSISYTRIS